MYIFYYFYSTPYLSTSDFAPRGTGSRKIFLVLVIYLRSVVVASPKIAIKLPGLTL